jgi:hypothetical protein
LGFNFGGAIANATAKHPTPRPINPTTGDIRNNPQVIAAIPVNSRIPEIIRG